MSIARIQAISVQPSATSSQLITIAPTRANDLIVVSVGCTPYTESIVSITDDAGNVYNATGTYVTSGSGGGSGFTDIWYVEGCIGGATQVTVTFSNPVSGIVEVLEYSGVITSGSLYDEDTRVSVSGPGASSYRGPGIAISNNGDLVVGVVYPEPTTMLNSTTTYDVPFNFIASTAPTSGAGVADTFNNTNPDEDSRYSPDFLGTSSGVVNICGSGASFLLDTNPPPSTTQTVFGCAGLTSQA